MTIEELITFCEEEEYNHRLNCKRYDDASGYTRSKDKNIRTTSAIREDTYADFYKKILDTMHKYQKVVAMLDKIRAEIEECKQYRGMTGNPVIDKHNVGLDKYYDLGLEKAIKIIDKYKAESEDEGKG